MRHISTDHPYFKEFVKIYNESVRHDNALGCHDDEYAMMIAKAYAKEHVIEWHRELFLSDFKAFYYHMFD